MVRKKDMWNRKLASAICLLISSTFTCGKYTVAQPIPDETLGRESSIVVPNVDANGTASDRIEGGASRGTNLFHSFKEFGVGKEQSVYINNPASINNIFIRVTGGNPSAILGKLNVTGNANLFLLNPHGVIFGPDASLDLKGSFLATTASSLSFADGTQFSAIPPKSSLLTISVPIGLQFGSTNANIDVQEASLQLLPGKTLGLVGGNINILSGDLIVPKGRIELGSVASNNLVSLNLAADNFTLGYQGVRNFQDINIKQSNNPEIALTSSIQTNDDGGNIHLQGRQIVLDNDSQILSTTNGAGVAGSITIDASELFVINGKSSEVSTLTTNAGNGGNIIINTKNLLLQNGGGLSTDSSILFDPNRQIISTATGKAGDLIINATESVELANDSSLSSETNAFGNAGSITINTAKLTIRDRSEVSVNSTSAIGDAGNLEIKARSVFIDNESKLAASSQSGKGGGNIRIENQDFLMLRRNSEITTNASGEGNGGNININTNVLVSQDTSKITAEAFAGQGGKIDIFTQGLFTSPDSIISASSKLGVNGEVEINRPESEPESALSELPEEPVDITDLIAQSCSSSGGPLSRSTASSEFIITGRGGLPPTPKEALRSDLALVDLGSLAPIQDRYAQAVIANQQAAKESAPIIEAQGWTLDSKGRVILTASAPTVTPEIPWLNSPSCHS